MSVITHQPDDPIGYFHEEITKIKKEMEEMNVSLLKKPRWDQPFSSWVAEIPFKHKMAGNPAI